MKQRHHATSRTIGLIALLIMMTPGATTLAADTPINMTAAWNLYSQKKYAASADAFEALIRQGKPNARLYYFAAMANREAGHSLRSKQLFQYIVTNFPGTPEATQAQSSLPAAAVAQTQSTPELPDIVKNALPKEMQAMLNTEAGRQAVKQAMAGQAANVERVNQAQKSGVLTANKAAALANAYIPSAAKAPTKKDVHDIHPFTAADIARDGANGIDQSRYPNCWFECSMSSLAALPRGQKLIANMIRYGEGRNYVVRFPNDGVEYIVTPDDIEASGVKDKAMWATILEAAQIQKFPDNAGAQGAENDQSRLDVGLGCITGARAELTSPGSVSAQELSSFIGGAIKSGNPIVCSTWDPMTLSKYPRLIFPLHAYTITGYDPAKDLITMRNPHGYNSRDFEKKDDPRHEEFEQLQDGVFKMSLPLFQKYFYQAARSFI